MRIHSRKSYRMKPNTEHTNYSPDGDKFVPSVTTILDVISKKSLIQWANNLGWQKKRVTEELNKAAEIGTLSHEYIEATIMNDGIKLAQINQQIEMLPYEMYTQVINCVESFRQWWREEYFNIKPVDCEVGLVTAFYGGTCDFVCYYKGKLTIIDFKTSSGFYFTQFLQLSAYAKAYEENFGKEIEQVAILRMDKKDGKKAKLKTIDEVPGGDIDYYYITFDKALDLYMLTNAIEQDWD